MVQRSLVGNTTLNADPSAGLMEGYLAAGADTLNIPDRMDTGLPDITSPVPDLKGVDFSRIDAYRNLFRED